MNKLETFQELGCSMSMKIHFLHSHEDFAPENLGLMSEEQGGKFHQGIKDMEHKYQGRMVKNMLADYCWMLNDIGLRLNIKDERQKEVSKEKENVRKEKLCFFCFLVHFKRCFKPVYTQA
ncbi:uncharacterized protein TNCV_3440461 [Trichonephila clavipes]|uniref:Uncharacterized protein n=1 Tax=Trichonephila clavipes TaxID=2585209 RepID=A0A8X6W665_TRICX|nr:uncharacterized protein TNCV_3440461 [Trichonephila clavipes]